MTEVATLALDLSLKLPEDIARHFKPLDRFMVLLDGDTLVLKRIIPSVTKIVEQASQTSSASTDEAMTLEQINDVVHKARRQRKHENR